MIAVFWYVAECSLVETDRSFGGKYCVYVQAVPVSDKSVAFYQIHTTNKKTVVFVVIALETSIFAP
jgi:hypothetical protein